MTYSLKLRLLVVLIFVVGVVGIIGGAISYDWAFDEAIEAQDTVLTQIAAVAARTRLDDDHSVAGGDIESQVTIKELGNEPTSPESGALWLMKDGWHDTGANGSKYRVVLRTRTDGSRFAVQQPTAIRDEVARDSATQALIPFAILVPCLMLVIWFVISRSLRSIVDLADKLDKRPHDDLTSLSAAHTPNELKPFILSINRLLDRVQAMMRQQQQFITDAAHELRTPITALSLQAENLEQANLSPDAEERLSRLREGARRAAYLVDQLLSLARYDDAIQAQADTSSLDTCAKQVVADLLPLATDRGIDLGFDAIEAVDVHGNSLMVSAVIRNLVENAIHAVPRDGWVDINIHHEQTDAILRVTDNGPGIPDGDLSRIFEPFFRGSRPSGNGTGLGLAIVRRIVTKLGGSVTLTNRTGMRLSGVEAVVRFPTQRNQSP